MLPRVTRRAAPLIAIALLAGCPDRPAPPPPVAPPPGPAELAALGSRVAEACGRCHLVPAPDSLTRARFAEVIPTMQGVPLPPGVAPLTDAEVEAARRWYEASAPLELPLPPAPPDETRLRFEVEPFTPPGLEKQSIPAVAHLRFLALSDPRRLDLLACEMRTSILFLLPAWVEGRQRALRPLARDLGYPARSEPVDLDRDGRLDLLIAGLGEMNPSNDEKGAALVLLQQPDRRFRAVRAAERLGRVSDVRAADLDGDGDLDLVACAFGWQAPGKLLLLERRGADADGAPRFAEHVLDERDGFIHVEPWDLDGDGRLDLVALLAQEHEQVVAFLNRGGLRFEARPLWRAPHPAWGSSGMERVDLDGDGDDDLLLSNGDALDDGLLKPYHGIAWLERTGPLRFEWRRIAIMPGCERALAGDLDGDGDLDVVAVAFLPQLEPARWRGLASVAWAERTPEGWTLRALERERCYHPSLAVGDYDADGDLDVAAGSWVWLERDGTPRYTAEHVTLFTQVR